MPERVVSFQGQSFHKLRRYCQRRGVVFKDPLFPASAQSLFFKRELPPGLSWKRPRVRNVMHSLAIYRNYSDICRDPRLFVDGISTRDLHQGSLGNCWMVAAISCLASEPSLWKKVIPDHMEQEWNPKRPDLYAGIFHFRFWRFGSWVDVVVDDRLPVSADGALLFCRSATPREFWSALLEKAYAKLNGCYEALEGGNTAEALIDFTGGVSEPLSLDREALSLQMDQRRALFQTLAQAHERKALITCFIRSVMECGLVRGHAYGITALKKVHVAERLSTGRKSRLLLLRMRNPWGTTDWTGAWGQGSQQWQQISRTDREKMGLAVRDIGEFWMEFEDFCHYFTDVVVCRLVEKSEEHARSQLSGVWDEQMDKRSRCGGCINHRDTFLHNPQFLFEVRGKEEEVLICLQQEDRRMRRKNGDGENLPIGFEVLKVEVNRFSRVQTVVEQAASSVYMDSRSVTVRACFSPGRYVVLPTTFLPGATGRFLLRLFSHSHIQLRLVSPSVFHCLLPQPTVVTTVHLCRVTGLSPGVYAVVRCENDSVRTPVFKAEGNPEFNLRSIFYRRYPRVHISIELWRKGVLWDSMLGEVRLKTAESERGRSHVMDLRRGLSRATVYLETSSSLCLTDL
uniref:Calpain catalytic domain-containing protein n=1 Tax=Periophthalmus magnuspinnatus TaxID=409849 RepID=A0A3B3ZHA0_9GOBI